MKYVFVALLLAATVASDCTADNCLRARVPGRKGGKKKSSASTTSASMVAADCTTVHCLRARAPGPRDQDGSIRPTTSTFSATEPCDMVRISTSEQKAANPSVEPVVTAQLAYDCLNSVPLHKTEALQLVDSMEPYLEWQSGEHTSGTDAVFRLLIWSQIRLGRRILQRVTSSHLMTYLHFFLP